MIDPSGSASDLDDIPVALLAVTVPHGIVLRSNESFRALLGGPPNADVRLVDLLVDADPAVVDGALAAGVDTAWISARLQLVDGDTRPIDLVPGRPHEVGGRLVSVVAIRDAAGDEVFDELVLKAHDILGEGVLVGDGERLLFANESACVLYGRSLEELRSSGPLFGLLVPAEQSRLGALVDQRTRSGFALPDRYETTISRPDGSTLDVEMSVKAAVSSDRVRTVSIVRDISERRAATVVLTRLALEDPLTGLPNRRLLEERIGQAVARSRRHHITDALVFLDLDHFKAVNDQAGHAVGDAVLRTVADRLTALVRPGDTVARLGGDEFVVLAEDLDGPAAVDALVARMAEAIQRPMLIEGCTWRISASIGVSRFGQDDGQDVGGLLGAADAAMYQAKSLR